MKLITWRPFPIFQATIVRSTWSMTKRVSVQLTSVKVRHTVRRSCGVASGASDARMITLTVAARRQAVTSVQRSSVSTVRTLSTTQSSVSWRPGVSCRVLSSCSHPSRGGTASLSHSSKYRCLFVWYQINEFLSPLWFLSLCLTVFIRECLHLTIGSAWRPGVPSFKNYLYRLLFVSVLNVYLLACPLLNTYFSSECYDTE